MFLSAYLSCSEHTYILHRIWNCDLLHARSVSMSSPKSELPGCLGSLLHVDFLHQYLPEFKFNTKIHAYMHKSDSWKLVNAKSFRYYRLRFLNPTIKRTGYKYYSLFACNEVWLIELIYYVPSTRFI
jgi:hypothetical protein